MPQRSRRARASAFRRCKFQESPIKNHTRHILRVLLSGAAAGLLLAAAGGAQAQAYVNATVGGELAPGVYGRINIGNAPPPPLIYAEPVIIHRPAVVVPLAPVMGDGALPWQQGGSDE